MIGKRLKELRGKRTQQEIADKLGLTRSTYANYEQGKSEPDINLLKTLASLYGVPIDYIVGRDELGEFQPNDPLLEEFHNALKDPDDGFFIEGYLKASEEDKKKIRQLWWEIRRTLKE